MENHVPGGYNGRILYIDLSDEKTRVDQIDDRFCRRYLGGTGFIAHYLLNEVRPGVDPLGPENKLIFALGPLTGLVLGGCARHSVGAKSPLTDSIAKSEVGGHWGSALKRAGFDALIIEGQAERPVYLWVHDGEVQIKDAAHLWGQNTMETQRAIRSELADNKIRVAMIGPAGENRVKYACIMHGLFSAAGRGGLGAVMGSKNLKAVAVKGEHLPPVAHPEGIKQVRNWLKENLGMLKGMSELGTGFPIARFEKIGNLPIRNFRDGDFPNVGKISPQAIKETLGMEMEGCFACPVRCKKAVAFETPYPVDRAYGGPEYETLAALGSNCGIDDVKAIIKGNEMCNAASLDTISTGVCIAFGMECFENGLLSSEDTGGIELTFGNADAMLQMIERIAQRQGLGDLLAEGTFRAAEKIGRGAEALAMQVKKLELPMHEPRLSVSLGLGYMVNPHGADHMDSMIDIFLSDLGTQPNVMIPDAGRLGFEPAPFEGMDPKKVALFKAFQIKRILFDSLVLCDFLPYSYAQLTQLTGAVTGWDTSTMEQFRVAERILTMCRLFNTREGLSAADDRLPARFFEPTQGGPLADQVLDFDQMERAKRYYYNLMGWDDNGVPSPEKLADLGIDDLRADTPADAV